MEMHLSHSVINMGETASSPELEFSSSLTSPSSSQSSPHSSSSIISGSSPIQSPAALPQAAEVQHCSIPICPAPSALSHARTTPPYLTKEQALRSLSDSIPHTMKLQQLKESDREHQKAASWHKKAGRRLSKELYVIVSLYALLQGALFIAVAQSSVFTCDDRWGPACIGAAVTLGTIISALDKLHRMGHEKQEVKKFERRQSAVYGKIEQLYFRGSACSLESLEPECTAPRDTALETEPGLLCVLISVHGLLVLAFLVAFSALMIASCTRMLCHGQCNCHT